MTKNRWPWAAVSCVGLLAGAAMVLGAPWIDDRSWDQKATDALTAQRFEAAAKFTQNFIDNAVGDPKLPKMQKQLHDCSLALAKEWISEGRETEAARLYLWIAEDGITPADQKPAMVKQASAIMTTALTEAKQKRLFARALQLQKDWAAVFPDKPSPLSAEDVETLRTDGFLSACQDKLNLLALDDLVAQFYPDHEPPWDDLAKKSHGDGPQAGHYRALSEIGWAGRFMAEYQAMPKDAPLRSNQAFCNEVEKMAVGRAEAWASQGNLPMTTEAVAAAKALVVTENKVSAVRMLETKLAGKPASEPRELSFPGPVRGHVVWQDAGTGYVGNDDVILDDDTDVAVKAGFLLTGGKIELHRAHLHLQGAPTQPVIFRNVTFNCQVGGSVEGENAIFINCNFARTGEMRMQRYAAKWTFANCMFYQSNFKSLGMASMGIHMTNCAWIEGTMPERAAIGDDEAGMYRDRWNDVKNCLFFRADVAPSAVWTTDQSNFVRCTVSGHSQFDSKTTLQLNLFIPEADPMAVKLRAQSLVSDKGDLQYMLARKPLDVGVPAMFWALLPVEGAEVKGKKGKRETPTDE